MSKYGTSEDYLISSNPSRGQRRTSGEKIEGKTFIPTPKTRPKTRKNFRQPFETPKTTLMKPSTSLTPLQQTDSWSESEESCQESFRGSQPDISQAFKEITTCLMFKSGGRYVLPSHSRNRGLVLLDMIKEHVDSKTPVAGSIDKLPSAIKQCEIATEQIIRMQTELLEMQKDLKASLLKEINPMSCNVKQCSEELRIITKEISTVTSTCVNHLDRLTERHEQLNDEISRFSSSISTDLTKCCNETRQLTEEITHIVPIQKSTVEKQEQIINDLGHIKISIETQRRPLYSDMVKRIKSIPSPLIIQASESETTNDIIQKIDSHKLKIFPRKLYKNDDIIQITCPSESHLKKTEDALKQIQVKFRYKQKRKMSIIIFNVPNYFEKEDLGDVIKEQVLHSYMDEDINEIKYFEPRQNKKNQNTLNHLLNVPYGLGVVLLKLGTFYIGTNRVFIRRKIFLSRCDWCQEIGHRSSNCSAEYPTCGICNDWHLTSACHSDEPKCGNCDFEKLNTGDPTIDINHKASDNSCPTYRKRLRDLINKQYISSRNQANTGRYRLGTLT